MIGGLHHIAGSVLAVLLCIAIVDVGISGIFARVRFAAGKTCSTRATLRDRLRVRQSVRHVGGAAMGEEETNPT